MSLDIPQDVVDRAREGDLDALSDLVRRSQTEVYTLALRLTGNEEDARDVVQDTYVRVMKGIRRFRGEAQISTWLYRVTANTAYSYLQRHKKHRTQPLAELEEAHPLPDASAVKPDEAIVAAELRDRLQAAVAGLAPSYRSVVVLKDIYNLPHEEIAASLGISVTACKVRLFRARRMLRDVLFDDGHREKAAV